MGHKPIRVANAVNINTALQEVWKAIDELKAQGVAVEEISTAIPEPSEPKVFEIKGEPVRYIDLDTYNADELKAYALTLDPPLVIDARFKNIETIKSLIENKL